METATKIKRRNSKPNDGFLYFMSEFQKRNKSFSKLRLASEAIRCWKLLSFDERNKFYMAAARSNYRLKENVDCDTKQSAPSACPPIKPKRDPCAPKKRKRDPCAMKRKPACPKRRKRKPSCGKRKRCSKPGPVTNNGYLNFIRSYRRKHCGLKPRELISKAARAWARLSEEKKDRYRRQACKVSQSPRHKRRRVCNK